MLIYEQSRFAYFAGSGTEPGRFESFLLYTSAPEEARGRTILMIIVPARRDPVRPDGRVSLSFYGGPGENGLMLRPIDFGASAVFAALCIRAYCAHLYTDIERQFWDSLSTQSKKPRSG
jgi:hypothetical protein